MATERKTTVVTVRSPARAGRMGSGRPRRKRAGEVNLAWAPNAKPMPNMSNRGESNKVYRFVRQTENVGWLVSSASVPTFTSYAPSLAGVAGYTDFTALFDQYRFVQVEIWLVPRVTSNSSNAANTGLLSSVVDYDDANNLTSTSAAMEYASCITTSGNMGHYHKFVPHTAVAAYSGAFTSYQNSSMQWIDVASTGVLYYGLKTAWTATDVVYDYDLVTRYVLEFRNVR